MQQIDSAIQPIFNNIPRTYKAMLSMLSIISLFIILWQSNIDYVQPLLKNFFLIIKKSTFNNNELIKNSKTTFVLKNNFMNYEYDIAFGDTLTKILTRYNINLKYIQMFINCDKYFSKIKTGQKLYFQFNDKRELKYLIWQLSNNEKRIYTLIQNKHVVLYKQIKNKHVVLHKKPQNRTWKYFVVNGIIKDNFFYSAKLAGIHAREIYNIIHFMKSQFNFHKLHYGDRFSILMRKSTLNEKKQVCKILGIKLTNKGKDYFAFRANNGKFYDKYGLSLRPSFMRFPTAKHFRISSKFNLHRLNPITGLISPHKGVDLALPIGTPVLSIGNGKIIVAKYGGSAGYYITILHNHNYITRYMHLKKLLVKEGQKVKKGECIAFSGNTGRSTGPHLHFEVWIHNKAVNPLTAKLSNMEYLIGKEKNQYLSQVKIFMKYIIS